MKLQKPISLILALVLLFSIVPLQAAAQTESAGSQTVTKQTTVNAGESVSVWNTDIAQNAVDSNKITVQAAEGSSYDVVFAEDSGTAAALAYYMESFTWETADYIRPDKDAEDGMLVSLFVHSGSVTLTVESNGEDLDAEPLKLYAGDSTPLDYTFLEKGQAADTVLPDKCSLTNVTVVLLGTSGTEIRRVVNADGHDYDTYRFSNADGALFDTYSNGSKIGTQLLPVSCIAAIDLDLYFGAMFVIPASDALRRVGTVKVTKGTAIYASPSIKERDESKLTSWATATPPLWRQARRSL